MGKTRDLAILAAGAALAPRTQRVYERSETHIHEHRAPTDESVKLLSEMEDKAREKVLATIPLKSNEFEGNMIVELDGMNNEYVLSVRAKLNGKRIEAVVREFANGSGQEAVRAALPKLRDELAQKLATEMLLETFERNALNLPRF